MIRSSVSRARVRGPRISSAGLNGIKRLRTAERRTPESISRSASATVARERRAQAAPGRIRGAVRPPTSVTPSLGAGDARLVVAAGRGRR
jgi:hypothetical protein